MNETRLEDAHFEVATGERCPACDAEILLTPRGGEVILACACGRAAALA